MSIHRHNAYIAQLTEKLLSLGLTQEQARYCACSYCDDFPLTGTDPVRLPPIHWETLEEAQRLQAKSTVESGEMDGYRIYHFLRTHKYDWQWARQAVAEAFGRTEEELDTLYSSDTDWLFVSANGVREMAAYLKETFTDDRLIWDIFRQAGLLSLPETKQRIDALFQMLGRDTGEALLRADLARFGWILYRFYNDPIGAIDYMLQKGLTAGDVLEMVRREPMILYHFKQQRTRSNGHDQAWIDRTIQQFLDRES